MKMRHLLLVVGFSLAGCGGSTDSASEETKKEERQEEEKTQEAKLTCSSYSWCTTWSPNDDAVANAPAMTGGKIPDGLYRKEEGSFASQAFAFAGNSVVSIDDGYQNHVGTYETSEGTLTMTFKTTCNAKEERDFTESSTPYTYEYAVEGDNLFLASVWKGKAGSVQRYQRVSDLCQETANFKCRVTNCQCRATVNKPIPATTGNPTAQCG